MSRVKIGPRVSRWWWAWAAALVLLMVGNVRDGQWAMLLLWPSLACVGATEYGRSLRQRDVLLVVGVVLAFASAATGYVLEDWLAVGVGAFLAVGLLVFLPTIRRGVPTCTVRTEELVGGTVAEAMHTLGFADRRQPRCLQAPRLVPVPRGEQDLGDPSLIVTAVSVDVISQGGGGVEQASISFGVADSDDPAVPQGEGRTARALARSEAHDRLVDVAGGVPADIRPQRFPGPAV